MRERTLTPAELRPGMWVRSFMFDSRPVWLPLAERPRRNPETGVYRVKFRVPPELRGRAAGWFWAAPTAQLAVRTEKEMRVKETAR